MDIIFSNEIIERIIKTALAILLPTIVYLLIKLIIERRTKKLHKGKHITYLKLFRSIAKYLAIIVAILAILSVNGVDTASILAGLGIASVIAGLALQDALKDAIMGFNIIADNYFAVGDVVAVNGVIGKVIEIGFKATKIRNLLNQNIEVIANRNIGSATVLSSQLDIDLNLPYEEKIEKAEKVLGKILEVIRDELKIEGANYIGIQDFASSAITYRLRFSIKPEAYPQTARDIRRIVKRELDAAHLAIPYQQIDIHNKA